MSSRIEQTFEKLRKENRAALIPFIMGYDPNADLTVALLEALPAAGADLIEIGIPFSDPMADGPIIQAAGKRALAAGATVKGILELVVGFRKHHTHTPIILMGYYNPIYRYGVDQFCKDAVQAGVDGIILVDLPPEEEHEIRKSLDDSGLKLIRLIAPTSDAERVKILTASASGFVYYISITGITGAASADTHAIRDKIKSLREATTLPIAVGFGIKTPTQVRQTADFADAAVVGSALVDIIAQQKSKDGALRAATTFVTDMAKGLRR